MDAFSGFQGTFRPGARQEVRPDSPFQIIPIPEEPSEVNSIDNPYDEISENLEVGDLYEAPFDNNNYDDLYQTPDDNNLV